MTKIQSILLILENADRLVAFAQDEAIKHNLNTQTVSTLASNAREAIDTFFSWVESTNKIQLLPSKEMRLVADEVAELGKKYSRETDRWLSIKASELHEQASILEKQGK
jgi:hypothetical protein